MITEHHAYVAGDIATANLLARIDELENQVLELENKIDELKDDSLSDWQAKNGLIDDYKQFFDDCFEHLAGHYPCPSVSSDYDKSIIFDAIGKGEA